MKFIYISQETGKLKKDMIFRGAKMIYDNFMFMKNLNPEKYKHLEMSWSDACKQAWHNAKAEQEKLNNLLTPNKPEETIQGTFKSNENFTGINYKLNN